MPNPPLKLLLWTAIVGVIFGLISFGELPEDVLRTSRNSLHPHQASGDIVVVSVDERSLRQFGRWPWPRRQHAEMIDRLSEAGARRIFFDVLLESASEAKDDKALAEAAREGGLEF